MVAVLIAPESILATGPWERLRLTYDVTLPLKHPGPGIAHDETYNAIVRIT